MGRCRKRAECGYGDEDAGETVLTGSNSVSIDRAAELKLNREQTRAANKASLTEVINNAALTEGEKTAAVEELARFRIFRAGVCL